MNRIYRLIALTVCILSGYLTYAQSAFTVSGTVKDAAGQPIIGAAVMVDGHSNAGAVTDIDGNYTVKVPASAGKKASLTVSCLSYETQQKQINNSSIINFVLAEDAEHLEEVVVVGYGAMRRSDLTGSVTSVKIDDEDAGRAASFDELLKGRAAGVSVISSNASPDAAVSIRVRGTTSLSGSNEPLYVVDGIIMSTPSNVTTFTQGSSSGGDEETNGLMGINPQDIASMEILKDASATAIYGSAGANGVVLITTKQANKDKPVVNFNAGMDISTQYRHMDVLNYNEYLEYVAAQGHSLDPFYRKDKETDEFIMHNGERVHQYQPADWQDFILRNAVSQRYYFSVSGRPEQLHYNFSIGYNNKQGIVKQTGAEQFTIRLNATKTLAKNFKIGTTANLAHIKSELTQGMSTTNLEGASSMMRSMLTSRPYMVNKGLDVEDELTDISDNLRATPARWLADFQSDRKEYRITPHLFAEWQITDWLQFKSSIGGDFRITEKLRWKGQTLNNGTEGSQSAITSQDTYRWNWDNTLNFNKKIKKHSINATLGTTTGRNQSNVSVIEAWNIPEHKSLTGGFNTHENGKTTYGESASSEQSFFARALYNYGDRYLITATYRIDGVSKFSKANRYSSFPSVALAWRLSEEPWLKNAEWLSMAKLRLGWGQVGNSAVSSYQIFSTYGTAVYPDHTPSNDAEYSVGLNPTNISNSGLKWETTRQWNAGLDLGLWDGRLSLTVDLYDKFTFDLLQQKKIPGSTGFSQTWVNDGSIRNRGLEISMDVTPIAIGDFEWNIAGNISFNRNKIEDIGSSGNGGTVYLAPGNPQECRYYLGSNIGTSNYMQAPANIFIDGQPIGLFYGYKTDGFVQEGETGIPLVAGGEPTAPGSIKYVDINGNGYLDADDRTVIGDPNPDFTYGFSTSFTWKDLTFSAAFDGSYGNELVNANLAQSTDTRKMSSATSYVNILRDAFYDAWTPQNPDAKYPALNSFLLEDIRRFQDRWVEDASYLRISNVSLSYRIPLPKNKVIQRMSAGISASNLYVFTKYSGWDPEVSSYGSSMTRIGIDIGSYPTARTFSFDLKFTF
ncbi:MAG: TonB-dependent receptor [Bacteroidales bacterium]|nr:TonB-dependent receptor [Bacteroidales bacterium]